MGFVAAVRAPRLLRSNWEGLAVDGRADPIRGLTAHIDGEASLVDVVKEISLCPGARVYSYTLVILVGQNDGIPNVVPEIGAKMLWQDSEIDVYMNGCRLVTLGAELPGLAWPDFTRLVATAGCNVTLYVNYGNCAR